MTIGRTVGLGLIGSATTMLVRNATRRAMHTPEGITRLPRAAKRGRGIGTVLVLAAAAGALLALADVLQEQRHHQTQP
jgi:hypothetical protein